MTPHLVDKLVELEGFEEGHFPVLKPHFEGSPFSTEELLFAVDDVKLFCADLALALQQPVIVAYTL